MYWIGLWRIWTNQGKQQKQEEIAYSTSMQAIMNHFNAGNIIRGYYHSEFPKHIIIAFWEADKMLGLVAMRAGSGIDEQHQSGMYFCWFSEDVQLATSSKKLYIQNNVTIGAMMLPLMKANEEFWMQYSVIYSDWDILSENGNKDLPEISYDLFSIWITVAIYLK